MYLQTFIIQNNWNFCLLWFTHADWEGLCCNRQPVLQQAAVGVLQAQEGGVSSCHRLALQIDHTYLLLNPIFTAGKSSNRFSFFYRVEGYQNYYTVLTALKHYSCNRWKHVTLWHTCPGSLTRVFFSSIKQKLTWSNYSWLDKTQ